MKNKSVLQIDKAYKDIQTILEKACSKSFEAVNAAMVQAYWHRGKVIVEEEQRGKQRAEYVKAILEGLSEKLSREYGEGFNITNLKYMRQFYLAFPIRHELREEHGGEDGLLSNAIDDKQKISKKNLQQAIKDLGKRNADNAEEYDMFQQYKKLMDEEAETQTKIKKALKVLEAAIIKKYPTLSTEA